MGWGRSAPVATRVSYSGHVSLWSQRDGGLPDQPVTVTARTLTEAVNLAMATALRAARTTPADVYEIAIALAKD